MPIRQGAVARGTDGTVSVRTGYTEMGQGCSPVTIQTAVEETGLPPETFTARRTRR
jgi:CO/xanthine dehydrogenase Mo-binding subunit